MTGKRLGLVGRLAVTTSTIAVVSVSLSLLLFHNAMEGRLDRLADAHVQSAATRVAAIAADLHRADGWSPTVLGEMHERAGAAGFAIALTDSRGQRLIVGPDRPAPRQTSASALVRVDGRVVGRLSLRQVVPDVFGRESRALRDQLEVLVEICAGLALLVALFGAAVVAYTLVRPLRRLTDAAERMNGGDLSARAGSGGGAEVEKLAGTLNRLASTLAREDELRRAAAADIAHELRTPVTGIVSRIEAAQDGVMADEAANLEAMHAEALRLAHLIRDVGQLADAERSDLRLDRAPVDLADVCAGRAAAYAGFFQAKAIDFQTRLEAAPLRGDARRLEQVVDNLLSNALRYTDPGGTVTLVSRRDGEDSVLEVHDTGIGISDDDLPRVFDRFWRSDRSRCRATGGSGVGLAVVRELVRAHQGTVELRSGSARGTVARVALPAQVTAGDPALALALA